MRHFDADNPLAYDYAYPASAIAQAPAQPRDAARLLVYDRAQSRVSYDSFKNIPKYLPAGAVLVCNQTKVLPARFMGQKSTGGKVELLFLSKQDHSFDVLANKKLCVGDSLVVFENKLVTVSEQLPKGYRVRPHFALSELYNCLRVYGQTPIPPYIKHSSLSEVALRREYQTVFAQQFGSVAAPTASLHFTKRLLNSLVRQGFALEYVTLHVGLGTFAPLTSEQLQSGRLHKEVYEVEPAVAKRLEAYRKLGRPIVAVGTTVVRTLESAADARGSLVRLSGSADLFIRPPYRFRFVDALITNFHVPKSSLMMLVAALIGRDKLLELYAGAIRKKFRLFSFGDGMLIK
ncbi:MAG: tRNA preQ1(34) S-adenosylmethionine ribosyltransferase-isomerase QueA [Candidatus Doudnabacteria bacterium]|nr:tRNA preQ1(34) S-adenosylmethionine ribosyltransferase-isomerase QueA [Candidatus Doudnabacteria bacterium]